jgi:DnaK suppressor protein
MQDGGDSAGHAQRRAAAAERIAAARTTTARLIGSLTRLWDGVVEASQAANIDDEHDPEGATVAFERAQLRDALKQARADLHDLDLAARRVRTGEYWVCERCAGPIAPARLEARPATRVCIACASSPPVGERPRRPSPR